MRVALTRPRADSEHMAALLEAAGIEVIISPVLEIVIEPPDDFSPMAYQAILLTSGNGAAALAASTTLRNARILAVGDATAGHAEQLGFADVESAGGDVRALIELAADRLAPADGPLLHARGQATRGDLSARLLAHGFAVDSVILYRAEPAERLDSALQQALADGRLDGVLAFSPRSAGQFGDLVASAGLARSLGSVVLYAMSAAVADAAAALPWAAVVIAAEPTQEALLASVAAAAAAETGASDMTSKKDPPEDPEPAAASDAAWFKTPTDDAALAEPVAEDAPIVADDDTGLGFDEQAAADAAGYAADPDIPDAPLRDPAAEQPARRRWPYILAALIVFFVGGLVAWPFVVPPVASYLPESVTSGLTDSRFGDRLGEIERRLVALDARISAVQSVATEHDASAAAIQNRRGIRLEKLETGLTQGDLAGAGLGDRIDQTEARLDQINRALVAASDGPEIGDRLDRLVARLEALEAAPSVPVAGLADGSEPTAGAAEAVRRLTARLAKLEKAIADNDADRGAAAGLARVNEEIGDLKRTLASFGDGATAQDERLAKLEASAVAGQSEVRSAGLAVTLSQLRAASRGAGPFVEELAAVKAFGADGPELNALAAPAASGVATLGDLRARFAAIAADIVQAARLPADDGGWLSQTVARLGQMVRFRRTDKVIGQGVDAIVARIELRLGADDLAAAVAEVKNLDGAAAKRAAAWLTAAEARLGVDRTTAELQARLLAALGSGGN